MTRLRKERSADKPRALKPDRRLSGWERLLGDYLAAERVRPYDARHHCLIFVAGAVKAITGVDLARGRKGRFTTLAGQQRHLRALGFDTVEELIDSLLPARRPGFARRGDVVMGADGIPGVCLGGRAAFSGPDGIVTAPGPWTRAWSVGEA